MMGCDENQLKRTGISSSSDQLSGTMPKVIRFSLPGGLYTMNMQPLEACTVHDISLAMSSLSIRGGPWLG